MESHLNELQFSQNFQEKPRNFSGVFIKAFPQPPCFFFLEQTTDRQIDLLFLVLRYTTHCTVLERLPEPPHKKSVIDDIQDIRLSPVPQ